MKGKVLFFFLKASQRGLKAVFSGLSLDESAKKKRGRGVGAEFSGRTFFFGVAGRMGTH